MYAVIQSNPHELNRQPIVHQVDAPTKEYAVRTARALARNIVKNHTSGRTLKYETRPWGAVIWHVIKDHRKNVNAFTRPISFRVAPVVTK